MILEASRITAIDASACQALREVVLAYQSAGVRFAVAAAPASVTDLLVTFGVLSPGSGGTPIADLKRSLAFPTVRAAMDALAVV